MVTQARCGVVSRVGLNSERIWIGCVEREAAVLYDGLVVGGNSNIACLAVHGVVAGIGLDDDFTAVVAVVLGLVGNGYWQTGEAWSVLLWYDAAEDAVAFDGCHLKRLACQGLQARQ